MSTLNCEKDLEDYIVNDDNNYCEHLRNRLNLDMVKFVGRQVHIGDANIIDLLYYGEKNINSDDVEHSFIIVELKYRPIEPKDLSQIGRYAAALYAYQEKANEIVRKCNDNKECNEEYDFRIYCVLCGTYISEDMGFITSGLLLDEDVVIDIIGINIEYVKADGFYPNLIDVSGKTDSNFDKTFVKGIKNGSIAKK